MTKSTKHLDITSIPLGKATRDRFGTFGNKNESWDTLINRILDEYEEMKKNKIPTGYHDVDYLYRE